jgi:glutamate synthase (NADPH/NADH)
LRAKFQGTPEQVINFFYYVAEELRGIMAKLGFRTINEMVGHAEFLRVDDGLRNTKTQHLDLGPILKPAWQMRPGAATFKSRQQDHRLYVRLDNKFIDESEQAIANGTPVKIECEVVNTDRALGTTLSNKVSKKYGEAGLPKDTIHIDMKGSAGQSLGAFMAPGITIELEGDANDYVGKGLSGGRLIVYPPKVSSFKSQENIIVGNVCLYGATSGEAYFRGIAAERFAVRNSGAYAVVEGVGDHGCEYMTGGRVVILGSTGRNFAAGMSGGIAYVLDLEQDFKGKCNTESVELETINDAAEIAAVKGMIENHKHYTGSEHAASILDNWAEILPKFVRVMPTDYKAVLEKRAGEPAKEARKGLNGFDLATDGYGPKDDEAKKPANGVEEMPAAKPAKPEPTVVDLEDSMVDGETTKKRMAAPLDKTRGFMKYKRQNEPYRPVAKRLKDWNELSSRLTEDELKVQAARCMDCGVPFCQSASSGGCPLGEL